MLSKYERLDFASSNTCTLELEKTGHYVMVIYCYELEGVCVVWRYAEVWQLNRQLCHQTQEIPVMASTIKIFSLAEANVSQPVWG